MTEVEKIAYAKSFIDKLANGINPLDDTPIPEGEIATKERISRCFHYVSGILDQHIECINSGTTVKNKANPKKKPVLPPFSITQEQLQKFEFSSVPITPSAMTKRINYLVKEEINAKRMSPLSYKKIYYWFRALDMIEWREWENRKSKRFPTPKGESIGLELRIIKSYGGKKPVIYLNDDAQRFIIDNIDAVISAERGTPAAYANAEISDEE